HNPTSNLKLGSGFAPIRRMIDKGINVTLGTDGVASNNNLNMFEEMHLTDIIHDGYHNDPTHIKSSEVLDMATVNGAKLQGRDDTGVLEVGKKADIIAVDLTKPHLYPNFDTLALLTCSAQAGDVCMTMADGRILYENGVFLTLDAEKVISDMKAAVARLYR
ncbi:MAG: amidohydrolase family protein, partial [Oscillospiraceae bacterium]|nr:amidohydrolase family protein [Oscillospiraceae bacterium]